MDVLLKMKLAGLHVLAAEQQQEAKTALSPYAANTISQTARPPGSGSSTSRPVASPSMGDRLRAFGRGVKDTAQAVRNSDGYKQVVWNPEMSTTRNLLGHGATVGSAFLGPVGWGARGVLAARGLMAARAAAQAGRTAAPAMATASPAAAGSTMANLARSTPTYLGNAVGGGMAGGTAGYGAGSIVDNARGRAVDDVPSLAGAVLDPARMVQSVGDRMMLRGAASGLGNLRSLFSRQGASAAAKDIATSVTGEHVSGAARPHTQVGQMDSLMQYNADSNAWGQRQDANAKSNVPALHLGPWYYDFDTDRGLEAAEAQREYNHKLDDLRARVGLSSVSPIRFD